MMARIRTREQLQTKLEEILGSRNVYFQPPSNITMKYPAIVYKLGPINTLRANNKPYLIFESYLITLIDKDPDSPIVRKFLNLPMCDFDRSYISDNLNHFVFTITL